MKVKTVGWLAALGMMLSSLTVWSLTPDRPSLSLDAPKPSWAGNDDADEPDLASFSAGRTLLAEGRLGHAVLKADQTNSTYLLVNVRGTDTAATGARAPLNLAVVIDRSGSMRGRRLDSALESARGMVRRLRDGDSVSVVTYNTETQVVVQPTTIDRFSRERLLSSLSSIVASGDTCISCGIDAGMAQLRQRSGMVDRMLLLSDGEATAGVRDLEGFRRLAARVRSMGAAISSIGVDVDYNERVMSALALESNGKHHFVENASTLASVFDEELDALVKTVAKDAELSVTLEPGVRVLKVFDRSFRQEGQRLSVPLGTFAAGEEKTLLLEIELPRGSAGERPVAKVGLDYADLATGGRGRCDGALAALLSADEERVSSLHPVVQARILRNETASALKEANQLWSQGRGDEARKELARRLTRVRNKQKVALGSAPAAARPKLEADFKRQEQALDSAGEGFAAPPAADPAPARKGKAQVRDNAEAATELAF